MTLSFSSFAQNRCRWGLLAIAWLLAGIVAPRSATAGDSVTVLDFEVGLTRSAISNVNANDARAAYSALLNTAARNRGYRVKSEATIYDDTAAFAAAFREGRLHLATLDTWQFLELEREPNLRPYFVAAAHGHVGRKYFVVVRKGNGLRTLADLPGRSVLCLESIRNNVCRSWLETVLPADPAGPASAFFDSLESAAKPTTAVLPVFFGQKAACIVDEIGFNLMKELNPQVGTALEVIATSPVYTDIIVCLGEQPWLGPPEAKADTVRAMTELGADVAGRQVLALFKISGLVPFSDDHIATVRALWRLRHESPAGDRRP